LDALRVLLQMWIVTHSTWMWFSHTNHTARNVWRYSTPLGMLDRHGRPAVACFFVFAAMLSHRQLTVLLASSSSVTAFAFESVRWIGRRFWRLWPQVFILSVITFIVAALGPVLFQWWTGSDAPVSFYPNCLNVPALVLEQFLVVNVAMVGEGLCQGRIWFLQILLDLTLITPAFVWLLVRARVVGVLLCAGVFIVSLSVRLGIYAPYWLYGWEHVSSWLVGFSLAEALSALELRAPLPLPGGSAGGGAKLSRRQIQCGWCAAFAVGVASVVLRSEPPFAELVPGSKATRRYGTTVEKLYTVPFAAAVALLVYMCQVDPDAAVARFLAHRRWQWPASLCYDAYLVATPGGAVATWLIVGSSDEPSVWRFVLSIPVQWAFVWTLAFLLNRGTDVFHSVRRRLLHSLQRLWST
jgi:hypothetical protein